jgi:glycosyltransferase involved in cell wall biosynthesis
LSSLAAEPAGKNQPAAEHTRLLAVVCDYREEGWPSMDLVADMLLAELAGGWAHQLRAERIQPPYRRWVTRLPFLGRLRLAVNADRLLNRFRHYPRHLRRSRHRFDLFHLCDHSYAHLVKELPADRTGVFCHDLDTFRCLLEPDREHRPRWFRAMARGILRGLQKAAVVFYTTNTVREAIQRHGLLDTGRLVQAPYGVSPVFRPNGEFPLPEPVSTLGHPFLLHVGSCIPRKRMDVLLDVFAAVRMRHPDVRLVKVGDAWSVPQLERIRALGIGSGIIHLGFVRQEVIAALYRKAALVLLPSEAEGFGLPLIESMACGAVVIASDIPVLREVGGAAGVYCPLADVPGWTETVCALLADPNGAPPLATRLNRVAPYSWASQARTIVEAYQRL